MLTGRRFRVGARDPGFHRDDVRLGGVGRGRVADLHRGRRSARNHQVGKAGRRPPRQRAGWPFLKLFLPSGQKLFSPQWSKIEAKKNILI